MVIFKYWSKYQVERVYLEGFSHIPEVRLYCQRLPGPDYSGWDYDVKVEVSANGRYVDKQNVKIRACAYLRRRLGDERVNQWKFLIGLVDKWA